MENMPSVHNVIVCTLCSCYPWPVLGLPPTWYKSAAYRSRTVMDPRGVLRELGLDLPDDVEVRARGPRGRRVGSRVVEAPDGAEAREGRPVVGRRRAEAVEDLREAVGGRVALTCHISAMS